MPVTGAVAAAVAGGRRRVVAAGSDAATGAARSGCRSGDVGRALLGLPRLRLQRCQALPPSGRPADGSLATVSRCPDDGGREPRPCLRARPRGRCRAASRRDGERRSELGRAARPFSAASRASRSFCAVARARPSIPVIASSSEVAPEDHRDRVGLALDVELAQQRARSAAAMRRASGGRSRVSQRRVGLRPGELARAGLEAGLLVLRAGECGLGRVQLQQRRRLGAARARRPAWRGRPRSRAAPTVGVDPVTRMPRQNGRAEQRPRRVQRSHKGQTVAKNAPVNAGKKC